ncbi:MAG: hypothetical protein AB8V23_03325 [Candidatus Midichloria sp.]
MEEKPLSSLLDAGSIVVLEGGSRVVRLVVDSVTVVEAVVVLVVCSIVVVVKVVVVLTVGSGVL